MVIQPLVEARVRDGLAVGDERCRAVLAAAERDPSLWELFQTPLMLDVAVLGSDGSGPWSVPEGTIEKREAYVIAKYVERMFTRRSEERRFKTADFHRWLGWLAFTLMIRKQAQLRLDDLNRDHLRTTAQRYIGLTMAAAAGVPTAAALRFLGYGGSPRWVGIASIYAGVSATVFASSGAVVGLLVGGAFAVVYFIHEVGTMKNPIRRDSKRCFIAAFWASPRPRSVWVYSGFSQPESSKRQPPSCCSAASAGSAAVCFAGYSRAAGWRSMSGPRWGF
jgi:hypothetical protein